VTIEINQHNGNLFWFDLEPNDEKEFIAIYILIDDKITLIETGPACSHDNLVEGITKAGITLSDIDFIVPTHIHLDHFGGGGQEALGLISEYLGLEKWPEDNPSSNLQ